MNSEELSRLVDGCRRDRPHHVGYRAGPGRLAAPPEPGRHPERRSTPGPPPRPHRPRDSGDGSRSTGRPCAAHATATYPPAAARRVRPAAPRRPRPADRRREDERDPRTQSTARVDYREISGGPIRSRPAARMSGFRFPRTGKAPAAHSSRGRCPWPQNGSSCDPPGCPVTPDAPGRFIRRRPSPHADLSEKPRPRVKRPWQVSGRARARRGHPRATPPGTRRRPPQHPGLSGQPRPRACRPRRAPSLRVPPRGHSPPKPMV
jgi:hypothetical protein